MEPAFTHALISRRSAVRGFTLGLASALMGWSQPGAEDRLRIGDSDIDVIWGTTQSDLSRADLLAWVSRCATGVARYFGRFPVSKARLSVVSREGRAGVAGGRTWGGRDPRTRISIGQHTTVDSLKRDWVLTHEFVHYGFPDMPDRHHWIEEGLATYIEPIARVGVGTQDPATAWFEMMRDMPQGLPGPADEGLDNTHTWGRTYWGGAIFCLFADVSIRKHTNNAKGLKDALQAIVAAGGTIEVGWAIERAFEIGDKAVSGTVLMSQYEQMGRKSSPVDLDGLWRELGVERRGNTVVFQDDAPLASIRKAILS
jgi:hypothetical protein